MVRAQQRVRVDAVSMRENEPLEEYEQRVKDAADARKARRFFFVRHHSVELIAKILDRPEEWVREVVQFKRLPVI